MKLGQFFKKMVGGSMILATMACPVFTSCYDDSKLWDEMGKVKDQVASLESRLNDELSALQYILGTDSKIKDVKWDDTNKKWKFTLADGTTFDFAPATNAENQQKFQSLITTVEVDGAKYWATYGADGTATALTDADGNMYPISVTPQVKTEDGVTYLSLDGETWVPTCSNPSVFVDVEVVYSDLYTDEEEAESDWNQETPLYVIFTLADGNTISVTLDGARIIIGGYAGLIKTQFVAPGKSVVIQVAMTSIKSFLKELPAGWKATENLEGFKYGMVEFTVTAPSADMIAKGDAAASGPFRIMGNAEGGSSVMGEATLTTEPFSVFSVGPASVTITMNDGLGGYICGISAKDNFDSEAVLNDIKAQVESEYWSPWYTDLNYQDYSLSESYQMIDPTITYGSEYVFWTVMLESWVDDATYTSGYNALGIKYGEFTYSDILQNEDMVVSSFDDVTTNLEFKGVTDVYMGFVEEGYYGLPDNAEIIDELNMNLRYVSMGMPDPAVSVSDFATDGVYAGSITGFSEEGMSLMPSSKYSVWFVIKKEGATSYSESDIIRFDYSTLALQPGGTLSVEASQLEITTVPRKYNSIEVSLVSADAAFIYYAWVQPDMLSTIADKSAYLLENGYVANTGATVTTSNLSPGTTMMLLTMAVDQSGKYSEPQYAPYTTPEYVYNDITVNVEVVGEPVKGTTTLKFSANGEVSQYIYYIGTADHTYYTSPSYLGGSSEIASAYIALNPDMFWLKKVNGDSAEAVTTSTSTYGDYVAVVVAKDASGVISKATILPFTVTFDFGNFVASKDANGNDNPDWLAKKPTVNITTETVGDFTHVNWTITNIPEGFTAQTAILHDDYLVDYPSDKDKANFLLTSSAINLEDVDPEGHSNAYCSPGYNVYVLIKDAEGNYYAPYKYECNISGGFGV